MFGAQHPHQHTTMLPDEIIAQLTGEFACREQQIQHLAALYTVWHSCAWSYTANNLDTPPLTTLGQHPRPDSDRQVVDLAGILPPCADPAHHPQRARMHHHTTSP